MKRHLTRAAIVVIILTIVCVAAVSFMSGSHPIAVFQRAWGRVATTSESVHAGDVVLDVRFDAQDHALSCEVAALKMALAYRGIPVQEAALLAVLGTDTTPKQQTPAGTVWGDPHRAFVGNVDGRMLVDGYGVYWEPISRAGSDYRPTRAFTRGTVQQLAASIAEGNPVLVWGFLGSGRRYSWMTPDGRLIPAILHEHVFVAHGFRGPADAPEGFFLMDPIYGQRYWETAEFVRVWSALDFAGVVIY